MGKCDSGMGVRRGAGNNRERRRTGDGAGWRKVFNSKRLGRRG